MTLGVGGTAALAAAQGDYAQSQADAGLQVFSQSCASCHGANLRGQSGPALAGPDFASNLSYSKMSAQQFYDFVRTQMPANAPGSLSEQQYLQVLAYILSKNGYPAGASPLSTSTLGSLQLLPYPGAHGSAQQGGDAAQASSN